MANNINAFDNYFEPQIRERGIGYYFNDLVKDVKNDNHLYSAQIMGTRNYNVSLKLNTKEDKILKANCNCPYFVDREKYCKHIYALLYALKGEKMNNKPRNMYPHYTVTSGAMVNINCPNCGANLRVISPSENIDCTYCHSSFALDIRLIGQAKKLNELLEQADLYYSAGDYKEAYYEFAKALRLDKDNKFIKYCMDISNKSKNLKTCLGLEDYSDLYEEMKEVFNASTTNEEQKRKLCISFINLISHHLNFHINKFGIEGHYIWSQLDTSMDYFYKILKELDLSNELKVRIYEKYIEVLEIQIRVYDTFSEYATNSKETLRKALNRIKTEKEKCEKNK